MENKLNTWEKAYRNTESLWVVKPDHILRTNVSLVPEGHVLDLGIGGGRNALFFAKMGYEVEGVDISKTAIERCIERARDANLTVKAEVQDLREIDIPQERYSLIIAASVLNFFKKIEVEELVEKMKQGLKNDGLVYISVFSPDDPGYERARKNKLEEIEKNTFYSPKRKTFIHFFSKEEILTFFAGFKVIYYDEGTGLDLWHGKPHYHGFISYMGQKSE